MNFIFLITILQSSRIDESNVLYYVCSISIIYHFQAVKKVQDNFKKLLYRYLCSEIGKPNAMKLLPQYSETLRNLEEMANILATKRLRI